MKRRIKMTILNALGCIILISPFIALFVYMANNSSVKDALWAFSIAFIIVAFMGLGVYLVGW